MSFDPEYQHSMHAERRDAVSHWRVVEEVAVPAHHDAQELRSERHPTITSDISAFEYDTAAVTALIAAHDRGWVQVTPGAREVLTVELLPLRDLPPTLGHVMMLDAFTGYHDDAVLGPRAVDTPTYLQTTDWVVLGSFPSDDMIALGHHAEQFIRVHVRTDALLRLRDVYVDPESVDATTPEDFAHSFMVRGGIPWSAVERIELVEVPARPYEDVVGAGMIGDIPDAADLRQWRRVNRQRIEAWRDRITRHST